MPNPHANRQQNAAVDAEAEGSSVTSKRLSRIDWATLLKRVHTVAALAAQSAVVGCT
jgi:hypothetical protein